MFSCDVVAFLWIYYVFTYGFPMYWPRPLAQPTIYIVRHADKIDSWPGGILDPYHPLSEEGVEFVFKKGAESIFATPEWSMRVQMALVLVTGFVVASTRPVRRVLDGLAQLPRSSAQGAVLVALGFVLVILVA